MEQKTELVLNDRVVEKIKTLIQEQQRVQSGLVSLVQTILDYEGLDGKWDFPRSEGNINITKLVRVEEPTTKDGE